jgi:predicted MFS family arabinose efflux permease
LAWHDIDLGGVVLSVAALFSLVFGILLLGSPQYWQLVPLFIIVGFILFAAFLLWQRRRVNRHAEPLLDISVLKNRLYILGSATSAIQQVAFGGVLFILPVFLLQVTRASAFETGLALLPMSVAIFALSVTGGRLSSVLQPKTVTLIAFLIAAAGAYLLRDVFSQSTQPFDIIPGTVIFGIGVGLLLSQLTNLTMSAVRKEQEIDASGFLNTAKNLGYSVGTALIGAILLVGIFNGLVAGISTSTLVSNGTTQAQVQQNLYAYAQNMQTSAPPSIPQNLIPEAQRILDSTISSAMHLTFVSLALILLLGFVIALFLPRQAKAIS